MSSESDHGLPPAKDSADSSEKLPSEVPFGERLLDDVAAAVERAQAEIDVWVSNFSKLDALQSPPHQPNGGARSVPISELFENSSHTCPHARDLSS